MSEAPRSYGDVTAEYLALARSAALVERRHDLVWVEGPDAVRFLDGLLSQIIEGVPAGTVRRSLLLAPNGKLRATLFMLVGEDRVGLFADRGMGPAVVGDLSRFKIRVDATIDQSAAELIEVWGPGASEALTAAGVAPPTGWSDTPFVAVLPLPGDRSARYVLGAEHRDALVAAGAVPAGSDAVDAIRIELGEPVVGTDVDERTIPQEADLVADAVDFTKGCYLGQELVARIDSRGHVNRHLRGVVLADNVLPPIGAELVAGDREVGTITSLAESLDLRAPVGLALVRREVDPGDEVEVRWEGGSARAEVRDLPLR